MPYQAQNISKSLANVGAEAHTPGVCPAVPSTLALDFDNFGQFFDVEPLDAGPVGWVRESLTDSKKV